MSIPISECLVHKAALGDAGAFDTLLDDLRSHVACGHGSYFQCPHDPPCPRASEESVHATWARLFEKMETLPCPRCGGSGEVCDYIDDRGCLNPEPWIMIPCSACQST